MILVYLCVVAVTAILSAGVYGLSQRQKDTTDPMLVERMSLAEQGLRKIANGDATPVITAGDYLDRIAQTYNKELNK